MRNVLVCFAVGCLLTQRGALADEIRINPGQTLVFDFQQTSVPPVGTDTLWSSFSGVSFRLVNATVTLYDGNKNAMGTVVQSGVSIPVFRTPGSAWTNDSAIVDFTAILAGTFHGTMAVTPTFSAPDGFVRYDSPIVQTADAVAQNTYLTASLRTLTVTSVTVVPEPSTNLLAIAAATCLLVPVLRRHRRWAALGRTS